MSFDDFVRSPSVRLGAGLRCNFVVAAHPEVRFTSRSRLGGIARLIPPVAGELFYKAILPRTFSEIINFGVITI